MSVVSSFYKQTIGMITGDGAAVLAAKNERKSNSAVNSQLASLKAKQVDDESRVDEAKDALRHAKIPKELITNGQAYIDNIETCYEDLLTAEETLAATNKSIKFFEDLSKEYAEETTL